MPQNQSNQANNSQTKTSTQIRNFYSENCGYLNLKFYNTSLMIAMYPFTGKDENGRSQYDLKAGVTTTISVEGAYALYNACEQILSGKVTDISLSIPCFNASLVIDRHQGPNGYETVLTGSKNNFTVAYVFPQMTASVTENGVQQQIQIETGVGALYKTIDGYLTGINADRHLDKLTEDYVKTLGSVMQGPPGSNTSNNQNNQKFQPRNNFYNRTNNQNKQRYQQPQNNPRPFNGPKQNNWGGQAQNFNDYNVPN